MDSPRATLLDQLTLMADSIRARILLALGTHELTVSELCEVLQLPQSTASRHLGVLGAGGWVASRREATSRFYSLALEQLDPGARRVWAIVREQIEATAAAAQDDRRLRRVLALRRTRSEAFFASAAGQWDRLRDELFGPVSPLRALLGLLDSSWVVGDLGCGTGQVAEALSPFVARVVAVDGSREMLDAARARLADAANVDLRVGTLERLPLEDASLDAACLMLVLHYVSDPRKVLDEAWRVVRPGGRLVVLDMLPHDHEEYRQSMGHVWMGFAGPKMSALMATAGFGQASWSALPPDPGVKGPSLFVATGARLAAPAADRRRPSQEPAIASS